MANEETLLQTQMFLKEFRNIFFLRLGRKKEKEDCSYSISDIKLELAMCLLKILLAKQKLVINLFYYYELQCLSQVYTE